MTLRKYLSMLVTLSGDALLVTMHNFTTNTRRTKLIGDR